MFVRCTIYEIWINSFWLFWCWSTFLLCCVWASAYNLEEGASYLTLFWYRPGSLVTGRFRKHQKSILLEFFRKFVQNFFVDYDKIADTISMFILVLKCCTNSCMLNRHVSLLGTQITSSSKHIIPWNSTLFNPCASVD